MSGRTLSIVVLGALSVGAGCKIRKPGNVGTLTGDLAFEAVSGLVDESDAGAIDVFIQDRPGICGEVPAGKGALTIHFPAGKTGVIQVGEADPPGPSFAVVWRRGDPSEKFTPYLSNGGEVEVVSASDAGLSGRFDIAFNGPDGGDPVRLSGQFDLAHCVRGASAAEQAAEKKNHHGPQE